MAGAIPDADALRGGSSPQPDLSVSRVQPLNLRLVGMAGSELEQAGGEVTQAADMAQQMDAHYNTIAAEAGINQLQQRAIELEHDPQQGFRNVQGGGVMQPDFYKDYTGRFNDAAQAISQSLPNDQARQFFQQRAGIQQAQYKGQLLSHISQQTDAFASNTETATVQSELARAAANPYPQIDPITGKMDDSFFQTSLQRIDGVLSARGARIGQPAAVTQHAIDQAHAAAWTSRITAINYDNPYVAEKMMEDHQQELGEAFPKVYAEVQRSVRDVQARDYAQQALAGGGLRVTPNQLAPAIEGSAPLAGDPDLKARLQKVVLAQESGGKETDAQGNVLTSPKGAQGSMQVMPMTQTDPGYGVRPAQPGPDGTISPDERARVGRDYLGAMVARYHDPALALAAYNAGPGQVDNWLAKYGDPRTGAISSAQFADKIPFAETKAYVQAGLQKVGGGTAAAPAAISSPTAKELETQLPGIIAKARDDAGQMYPGDPRFADSVASRVEGQARLIIAGFQNQQMAARDMLTRGLVGTQPNGSDAPKTVDQLLADPRMKDAWNQATPEVQLSVQQHFAKGGDDPQRTPDTEKLYYSALGMAGTDPEKFKNAPLDALIGQIPHANLEHLMQLQFSMRNGENKDAAKQANFQEALGLASRFRIMEAPPSSLPDTNPKVQAYKEFAGRMQTELEQFAAANGGKRPNQDQMLNIARTLTAQVTVPTSRLGGLWTTNAQVPVYALTPQQEGQAQVTLTPQDTQRLTSGFVARYGQQPTPAQLQQIRLTEQLHPNDPAARQALDQSIRASLKARPSRAVAGTITQAAGP